MKPKQRKRRQQPGFTWTLRAQRRSVAKRPVPCGTTDCTGCTIGPR